MRGPRLSSATGLNHLIAKEAKETAVADCQDIRCLLCLQGGRLTILSRRASNHFGLDGVGQRMALINHTPMNYSQSAASGHFTYIFLLTGEKASSVSILQKVIFLTQEK